ncbi:MULTISPECIES: hypothetical protein [Niastella]|uniref:Prolyl-tRNA synthetase n=1 Tax=Niastella soli TaxID=2821487 RepID=A0ABS3YXF6_9BACT|nr:hypothetical protein [Niastella soli]MBO9201836.1 hypothetical protein [Niastella soli]
MRLRNILPVMLAIATLSSCSVYRSGQTPDDVYYSPGRTVDDSYLTVDNPRKGRSYDRYDNSNPEDNYLRMRQYGSRWNTFDSYNDWQYNGGYYGGYSPYTPYSSFYGPSMYSGYGGFYGGYGIGMPYAYGYYNPWAMTAFNPYFSSFYYWNSYYNPYCGGMIVSAKSNPVAYQSVRNFNLSSYTNNNYNNRNVNSNRPIYNSANGRYNTSNSNNNGNSGGLHRSLSNDSYYSPSQRSSSSPSYTPSTPVRSYSPSYGGGSSGGSSGGGGGTGSGGARPSRGH